MDARPPVLRRLLALVAMLLAGLLLAACSAGRDDSGDSSSEAGVAPVAAPANPNTDRQGAAEEKAGGTGTGPTQLGTRNRPLVYTGSLAVTAGNVPDAAARAISATLAAGGYVAADERRVTGPDDDISATLTLKVPSVRFTGTVDALAKLGTETSRRLATEDLQTSTIDLDARIAAQRASVNRVRALLGRANSITELAAIERELTTRETELATSEAAKRTSADRVAYSTITLSVTEPDAPPKSQPKKERGLAVGLKNGWNAFVVTVVVVLTIVGWLAPFLIVGALIGVPLWWALRRLRPRRSEPVSPAPSGTYTHLREPSRTPEKPETPENPEKPEPAESGSPRSDV